MRKNNQHNTFHIESKYLKHIDNMLKEHFDSGSFMLMDDIIQCVIDKDEKYKKKIDDFEDELFTIDFYSIFVEDDSLNFTNIHYISDKEKTHTPRTYLDIANEFPEYFSDVKEIKDGDSLSEHTKICLCLSYMEYIYYKYTNGYYEGTSKLVKGRKTYTYSYYYQVCLFYGLDTRYYMYGEMYSEMLLLYKMILESKEKKSHPTLEIRYKKKKQEFNRFNWLYNDMEKVFKERFPNLTLDKINELFEKDSKVGRKAKDINLLIWGVYHLMKNHHSAFKNSQTNIISDICKFSLEYLDFLNIPNTLISDNIIDYFKKTKIAPTWVYPWVGTPSYSSIEEYIIQEHITIK